MNVYFTSSTERIISSKELYKHILHTLKVCGCENTNRYLNYLIEDKQNLDRNVHSLHKITKQRIKKSALLICDISQPSITLGALIEYAINQNIPVLCLCDIKMQGHLPTLVKYYDSKILTLLIYDENTIEYELEKFIRNFKPSKIKFNVFVSPELDRYMKWYSHKYSVSKSDFFRDLINKHANNDNEYNKIKE